MEISNKRIIHESPPRAISPFTTLVVMNGSLSAQFGWLFFGFGMIFLLIFGSGFKYLGQSQKSWQTTTAKIDTFYYSGSSESKQKIYKYQYTFSYRGKTYNGSSYSSSWEGQGSEAVVSFNPKNPMDSCIKGMRRTDFPVWIGFLVLIFPLVGLIVLLTEIPYNITSALLLRHGNFTTGTIVEKKATGGSISITTNNRKETFPIYAYTFKYVAGVQNFTVKVKTHLCAKVEDEKEEIILYHKDNYALARVYDAIPAAPEISPEGRILEVPLSGFKYLIAPFIALVINGIIALVFWGA